MDNKQLIGQRINSALAMSDVKQKDLAAYLGVQDNQVSYFCSGRRTPNAEQIISIAKHLGFSSDYLLGLSDIPNPDTTIQAVHSVTGLSPGAIVKLSDIYKNNQDTGFSDIISLLIEDDNAEYFLSIISSLFSCTSESELISTKIDGTEMSLYKENLLKAVFQTKIIENLSELAKRYGGNKNGKH